LALALDDEHALARRRPVTIAAVPRPVGGPFDISWPDRWQREAIDAVLQHLGSDERLRILVDDPAKAIHGTLFEGHVYVEDGTAMIIHDRSGRSDVFPWKLPSGPVLRIELVEPMARSVLLYEHPDWRSG
jgi:hypothetical protein